MSILTISVDDPYIKRARRMADENTRSRVREVLRSAPDGADRDEMLAHLVQLEVSDDRRAVFRCDAGWKYEAWRRWMAHTRPDVEYHDDEPTWAWTEDMVDQLRDVPRVDLSQCSLDPDGPGMGFHVYQRTFAPDGLTNGADTDGRIVLAALRVTPHGVTGHLSHELAARCLITDEELLHVSARHTARHRRTVEFLRQSREWSDAPAYRELAIIQQALLKGVALEHHPVKPPRAMRRQAMRDGDEPMETEVRVVRWRRSVPIDQAPGDSREAAGGTHSSHRRHWVRGHIRQQWFPAAGTHRAIYIAPHQRGDATTGCAARTPLVNVVGHQRPSEGRAAKLVG